jgi:hypothetical protein
LLAHHGMVGGSDIAEILLKVALKHQKSKIKINRLFCFEQFLKGKLRKSQLHFNYKAV